MTVDERLENQRKKTELATLKMQEREAKAQKGPSMLYEALKANNNRKRIPISRKTPDKEHSGKEIGRGYALGRYLQENVAAFRSIQTQFRHSAIGGGPKLSLAIDDEKKAQDASEWFNSVWAKECDAIDDMPWAEVIANIGDAVRREGDILVVYDDIVSYGALRFFEADQIVPVSDGQWEKAATQPVSKFPWKYRSSADGRKFVPYEQSSGVVRDKTGAVAAYIATSERGLTTADYDKVTIFPAWHPRRSPLGIAKLVKAPWRFNKFRGDPASWVVSNNLQDIYEMLSAELQSAKVAAQNAAVVTVDPESESAFVRALQQTNRFTDEEIASLLYGDASEGTVGMLGQNHEQLDALTGGETGYANPGEDVKIHDHDRPAASIREFADWMQVSCGAVFGLGRSRSTGKAEASYTAFRGEELISWAAFAWEQKFLERRICDWIGQKALQTALKNGEVKGLPDGWEKKMVWQWPEMPEVDNLKAMNALRLAMKNGAKTLESVMGPGWRNKLTRYASQLEVARRLDVPLSVFETVSGSLVDVEKKEAQIGDDNE